MADQKLDQLTEDTSPLTTDLVYVEHDPAGTPADRKVQIGNLPFQPLDSDLTAIAALSTTAYGRALLALADATALRTAAGLGTAATHATTDYEPAGAVATEATARANGDANAVQRANHTGTQLAATVSDFDAQVNTHHVNDLTVPSAATAWNNKRLTGLGDATAATDALNRQTGDARYDTLGAAAATVSDTAYDATTWDGITGVAPSKNAVRDKLELLASLTVPVAANRVLAFGHSYLTGGGAGDADSQWITLFSGLTRCDVVDLGVGGSQIANDESWLGATQGAGGWAWLLQNVNGARGSAPYVPANVLPLLHFGHNDMAQHSHDGTGAPRTVFKTALRTCLSRLAASRIFEDTDGSVVLGGTTWQGAVVGQKNNSGSQYRPFPGNAATFTITLPADFEGGSIAIGLTVWPTSDGQITWTGTASQLPATTTLAGLAYANGGVANRRDSSNGHVVRVTGLLASDAGKTIIGTYGAGAGTTQSTPTAPGALTTNGTAGVTTYGYKRIYRFMNGDTLPSTETTIATGNATLSGANSITIPAGPAWPAGVVQELIYRSTGGTAGLIQILTAPAAYNDVGGQTAYTPNTTNPLVGGAALDYWQIEANTPITRGVVVKLNRVITYVNSATDADVTNYNTDIASVLAEFTAGQWLAVDIDTTLNKTATLFAADGVHPNDRGHAAVAVAVLAQLTAWTAGLPSTDVALQSRVARRVTSRRIANQRYSADIPLGLGYIPANGSIANANLPFNGIGTADYQLNSTIKVIDLSNLALTLDADPYDDIEVELAAMVTNVAVRADIDAAFLDASNNVIRYFAANPAFPTTVGVFGWPAWNAPNEAVVRPVSGKAFSTVLPGDIITWNTVPGQVRVALVGKTASATNRLLYGGGSSTSPTLSLHVKNVGRRNAGFNTS